MSLVLRDSIILKIPR